MKCIKWFVAISSVVLLLSGCKDEEIINNIPPQKIDFRFLVLEHPTLQSFGGIKKFEGYGYNRNGVYVCNINSDATSGYAFLAFDATCPKESDFKTAVLPENTSILKLKCPKCGTIYDLRDLGKGGGTALTRYGVRTLSYGYQFQVLN